MKFLVIWYVTSWVSMPCPDYKPDPYTGKYPTVSCAVNHGRNVTTKMEKEFAIKEEAESFIKNAPLGMREEDFMLVEVNESPAPVREEKEK